MATPFISFLFLLSLIRSSFTPAPAQAAISSSSIQNCQERCGDVEIRYPFGIGPSCSLPGFEVTCDEHRGVPRLSDFPDLPLLEITPDRVRVDSHPTLMATCMSTTGSIALELDLSLSADSPYTIPADANELTVIGCGTYGNVQSHGSIVTCSTHCSAQDQPVDGSCNLIGCCKVEFSQDMKHLVADMIGGGNESDPFEFSDCSYAFVVEKGGYSFKRSDIEKEFNSTANISMVLDWAIGEGKCAEATGSLDYACGRNSTCLESQRGSGYLCGCSDGYQGNPYVDGDQGCQDVDECSDGSGNKTCVPEATCLNEVASFKCICPKGFYGDGRINGSKCNKRFPVIQVVTGAIICTGVITLAIYCSFWALRKRKDVIRRAEYFEKNGGFLLQQHLSSHCGLAKCTQLYSAEELKRATDNYSSNRVVGHGGYGTVYKGILRDGTAVAIKKSQSLVESQTEQFVNEIIILTQVNHKNVVRLLGCCLETKVPMLVYEFIPNGSLYQKLYGTANSHISWQDRLGIATEVAEALSYLHSTTSRPIYHRDIKSSNILLDKNDTAKIADFGISKLVPLGKSKLSTKPLGTFGYLDPEYINTGKLTEKSDVYSFGVVLLELLTGRNPTLPNSSVEYKDLAAFFMSSVSAGNFRTVLKAEINVEGKLEELQAFANIAHRCLSDKGQERPTMKVVLQDLCNLRAESLEHLRQTETM